MQRTTLRAISGEFHATEREAAFQASQFRETLRHARLLFLLSAILNLLFLASDWRFHGQPHFYVAVPARMFLVVFSLLCVVLAAKVARVRTLQRLTLSWALVAAVCVALLVTSRTDIALFVVLLLPTIFLLSLPLRFAAITSVGVGTSCLLLSAYLLPPPIPATALGLLLGVAILDVALILVVVRGNRHRRLEWAAAQAERRANAELAASRQMFQTLFQGVPIPVVVSTLPEGRVTAMNDAALALFDLPDIASIADLRTSDGVAEADRHRVRSFVASGTPIRNLEITVLLGDRRTRNVLLSAEATTIDGEMSLISSFVDITDRKAVEMAARDAADRDVLTGLSNRGLFQTTLAKDIAAATKSEARVGLILLDLDGFKAVNDSLGHVAGDALLQEVARRLTAIAGPADLVARLGGDEFVLITACDTRVGEPIRRLQSVITAILDGLAPPAAIAGRSLRLRASLGVALFPDHGRTAADLLTNADLALYAAKGAGRNQAVIFEPALRAAVDAGIAVAGEIRAAIPEGRIVPFYQPKVCLASGAIVGFEALARWRHPERGVLGPDAFRIAFDDREIGIAVGACIAERVARDVGAWLAAGLDPGRIFINLSTPQFAERDFSTGLLATFSRAGVPHARVGVEVTEMVLLGSHADRVSRVLDELHEAGVRVALDDFGTGYASLTHLKRFPVDEIKIDRSFVADVIHDANDAAIVTAVLQLGRSLGLDVTAEGVETTEQVAFLRAAGATIAQGYHFARPIPAAEVPALLVGQGVTFALPRRVDAA